VSASLRPLLRDAGTGTLSVYAGVGKLPSQLALARRVLTGTPRAIASSPDHVTAPWALSVIASHAALARYGAAAFDTALNATADDAEVLTRLAPGLSAADATFCDAFQAAVEYAAFWLGEMTVPREIGLMYYPRDAWEFWTLPETADVALNLQVRAAQYASRLAAVRWLAVVCEDSCLPVARCAHPRVGVCEI
jgi:hypothetical protein